MNFMNGEKGIKTITHVLTHLNGLLGRVEEFFEIANAGDSTCNLKHRRTLSYRGKGIAAQPLQENDSLIAFHVCLPCLNKHGVGLPKPKALSP